MSDESKQVSFVQKVIDFVKGGDEGKVARFQKKLVKSWNDQIKIRKDEIENANEEISDLKESLEEAVLNVDLNRIQTTQDTANYIEEYSQKLHNIQDAISQKEEEITKAEGDIADFQALIGLVK